MAAAPERPPRQGRAWPSASPRRDRGHHAQCEESASERDTQLASVYGTLLKRLNKSRRTDWRLQGEWMVQEEAAGRGDCRGRPGGRSRPWRGRLSPGRGGGPGVPTGDTGGHTHTLHRDARLWVCAVLQDVTCHSCRICRRLCATCLHLPAKLVSLFQHKRAFLVNASRRCSVPGGLTQACQGASGRAPSSGLPEVLVTALQGLLSHLQTHGKASLS